MTLAPTSIVELFFCVLVLRLTRCVLGLPERETARLCFQLFLNHQRVHARSSPHLAASYDSVYCAMCAL